MKKYILSIVLTLLFAACERYEMPMQVNGYVNLNLQFDRNILPIYHEVDYLADGTTQTRSSRVGNNDARPYELRYVVCCYLVDDQGAHPSNPVSTFRYLNEDLEQPDYRCNFTLPAGRYLIKVWADYVLRGQGADYFYDTTSFYDIALTGLLDSYEGSTELRQAFIGETTVEVPASFSIDDPATIEAKVDMTRPLARFKFVTTDLNEFVANNLGITDPDEAAHVNFSQYRVLFRYTGFFPNRFNIFTDKPFDAARGYQFITTMPEPTDISEATLGFDYVLVSNQASSVSVAIGIYRSDGTLLSFCNPIEIPLLRDHETVVRGRFFSTHSSGNVAINTEFDGNFTVYVN